MKRTTKSSGNEQIKKEDVKQAVIVDYKGLGCKFPGGGLSIKPLVQYTLEWLTIENFNEVFICCLPDNAQQLRDFVKAFLKAGNVSSSTTIQVHSSESNKSTGDCLRDLDSKALIKTDFVIMDVGCCGNLPLSELLDSHKNLRKNDKNAILTSTVRSVFTKDPTKVGEFPTYVTDPRSGLLLHYVAGRVSENECPNSIARVQTGRSLNIPTNIFLERELIKIHTNLCSTNLSIYSANVPALFAELFDAHSEAELIQAAFDNQEVLGGSVYIQIVDDLFSQRMADFGFLINQKWEKFDTDLIYKRNERSQVLRQLVNDSLIDCTRLNSEDYFVNLDESEETETESESESEVSILDDDEAFLNEVLDSLVRGYEESIKNENLVLEVNSSKHAYNISINDVYSTIARALLLLPNKLNNNAPKNSSEYSKIIEESILKFRKFLLNYLKNDESRELFMYTLEDFCVSGEIDHLNDVVLAKIFYKLYDIDALDEERILEWSKIADDADEARKQLRFKPALKQLIQALEADSDEEEDD